MNILHYVIAIALVTGSTANSALHSGKKKSQHKESHTNTSHHDEWAPPLAHEPELAPITKKDAAISSSKGEKKQHEETAPHEEKKSIYDRMGSIIGQLKNLQRDVKTHSPAASGSGRRSKKEAAHS